MFQSTPPRGGRQLEGLKVASSTKVSIHAPALGADQMGKDLEIMDFKFQPTPRTGGPTFKCHTWHELLRVCIHAPTRGAT